MISYGTQERTERWEIWMVGGHLENRFGNENEIWMKVLRGMDSSALHGFWTREEVWMYKFQNDREVWVKNFGSEGSETSYPFLL